MDEGVAHLKDQGVSDFDGSGIAFGHDTDGYWRCCIDCANHGAEWDSRVLANGLETAETHAGGCNFTQEEAREMGVS